MTQSIAPKRATRRVDPGRNASDPGLVVLDTHAWIWLVQGDASSLGTTTQALLRDAGLAGRVRVPAISVWEVGMLVAKERLRLGMPCVQRVEAALSGPGIALAPLLPEVAIEATCLPGELHADTADRIIAATARLTDATLVTADAKLLAYAQAGYLRAAKASS